MNRQPGSWKIVSGLSSYRRLRHGKPKGTPRILCRWGLRSPSPSTISRPSRRASSVEEAAAEAFEQGKDANQNGDLYIANTVLFAIVLFFCGVYMKWESPNVRTGMLIVTTAIFGFAVFLMVSLLLKVGFL